jgi:hypothetical protein
MLAIAATAAADTPAEPNDDITQASGPLVAGTPYTGDFKDANDEDWLVFYVNGPKQITVSVTKTGAGCSDSLDASLLDGDGDVTESGFSSNTVEVESDKTREIDYTTPAAGRYYVLLADDCAGDPYQVTVGPSDAVVTSSPYQADAPTPNTTPIPEPDDDIAHAAGPAASGPAYGGAFESPNDTDWIVFYVNGPKQIDAEVTKVGHGCSGSLDATLLSGDGDAVSDFYPFTVKSNETVHLTYTTPSAGRYYVKLADDCTGDPYQVRFLPGDAISTAPTVPGAPVPSPAATREPNDSVADAFGPIAGATAYGGTIDTVNDKDYYELLVPAGKQLDVAVTKVGDGCGPSIDAALFTDETGDDVRTATVNSNTTEHLTATPDFDSTYYLRVSGSCAGNPYQFRADPADALVRTFYVPSTPTHHTSSACKRARSKVKSAAKAYRKAKSRYRHAHGRGAKVRAKKKYRSAGRKLRSARRHMNAVC